MPLDPSSSEPTRRGMLLGVGVVGVAGTLTACGGGSKKDASGSSSPGGSSSTQLAKASDIPVGGGKIFKDEKVVVTQPTQGEFKAYSATCTHRGCTVGSIAGGQIHCPCHGSAFNITDGSVAHGPAAKPLPSKAITVENGEIKLG
jgi:Rieske Fe-S protein